MYVCMYVCMYVLEQIQPQLKKFQQTLLQSNIDQEISVYQLLNHPLNSDHIVKLYILNNLVYIKH